MKTVSVATTSQIREGELLAVKVENQKVILTKIDDKIYAVENKCPHLGMPLAKGKVCDRAVTCPWHGASFDLTTGENVKWVGSFAGIPLPEWSHQVLSLGKSAQSIPTYPVTIQGDEVSISI
ncbi:Rieske 2Fe-2S domain-containing protein [Chamaesiphon sp. OTE_20_metabat_361]|uniref:Rieske (2Fe-2S) protein n=1 Tax=Chamaesiphon sp. OTE_20_metabat_361 TaxID=2964689 RepID=UPI00286B936C|nr:Rieske 2Fe-2S domain-containing protein [Chamaesiphon sp. OTE_20_metabat_361]